MDKNIFIGHFWDTFDVFWLRYLPRVSYVLQLTLPRKPSRLRVADQNVVITPSSFGVSSIFCRIFTVQEKHNIHIFKGLCGLNLIKSGTLLHSGAPYMKMGIELKFCLGSSLLKTYFMGSFDHNNSHAGAWFINRSYNK